ncbi:hypothetical protein D6833_02045 [Candidatus Parcubacteria bacterium]|nr:MAG: hypothetical protein D6833_02045 [Candidatus Parcubacteria bacterium]
MSIWRRLGLSKDQRMARRWWKVRRAGQDYGAIFSAVMEDPNVKLISLVRIGEEWHGEVTDWNNGVTVGPHSRDRRRAALWAYVRHLKRMCGKA